MLLAQVAAFISFDNARARSSTKSSRKMVRTALEKYESIESEVGEPIRRFR